MYKFDDDKELVYFADAREAAEHWASCLSNEDAEYEFKYYLDWNYSVLEVVKKHLTYEDLYNEWLYYIADKIEDDEITNYFYVEPSGKDDETL